MTTVLFSNSKSGKNLRNKLREKKLRSYLGDNGHLYSTKSFDELEKIVSGLHKDNPEKIILDSGDGGITVFLSLLKKYWPQEKELPLFGLIPGGTFNLLSKQCKIKKPKKYIKDIVNANNDEIYSQEVDMVKVTDDRDMVSYGFNFGLGSLVTLLEEYYKHKRLKHLKVGWILGRIMFSKMFRQKYYDHFAKQTPLEVMANVKGIKQDYSKDYLGIAVQTIKSIGMKFSKPFYKAQEKSGTFHAMGTGMELRDLLFYSLPFYFGKPVPNMDLDLQTESLVIESARPIKYQVNGELDLMGKPYFANRMQVEHGLSLNIIKPSPKRKF